MNGSIWEGAFLASIHGTAGFQHMPPERCRAVAEAAVQIADAAVAAVEKRRKESLAAELDRMPPECAGVLEAPATLPAAPPATKHGWKKR